MKTKDEVFMTHKEVFMCRNRVCRLGRNFTEDFFPSHISTPPSKLVSEGSEGIY